MKVLHNKVEIADPNRMKIRFVLPLPPIRSYHEASSGENHVEGAISGSELIEDTEESSGTVECSNISRCHDTH